MSVVPASDVEDKAAATAAAAPVVVAAAPVIVVAPVVATEAVVTHDIMAVEGVFVKQKIELLELATGYETQNKYKVGICLDFGLSACYIRALKSIPSIFCARRCMSSITGPREDKCLR